MKIEWSDSLSTGHSIIDSQHKELINRVNMLLRAMSVGKGRSELDNTVKFIEEYVAEHFSTEEKLMDAYGYKDSPSHKAEHKKLVDDFTAQKEKFSTEGTNSLEVIKTYNRLTEWVKNHIMTTDMKLAEFLKKKQSFIP